MAGLDPRYRGLEHTNAGGELLLVWCVLIWAYLVLRRFRRGRP
jgi:hypothetical protein